MSSCLSTFYPPPSPPTHTHRPTLPNGHSSGCTSIRLSHGDEVVSACQQTLAAPWEKCLLCLICKGRREDEGIYCVSAHLCFWLTSLRVTPTPHPTPTQPNPTLHSFLSDPHSAEPTGPLLLRLLAVVKKKNPAPSAAYLLIFN